MKRTKFRQWLYLGVAVGAELLKLLRPSDPDVLVELSAIAVSFFVIGTVELGVSYLESKLP